MQHKKLILVGDSGSGKTTFAMKATTGEDTIEHISTQGLEIYQVNSDNNITFGMWDITGIVDLDGSRSGYYAGADCCLLFCDASTEKTMVERKISIGSWIDEVRLICPDVPIFIVLNKRDLVDEDTVFELLGVKIGIDVRGIQVISSRSAEDVERVLHVASLPSNYT